MTETGDKVRKIKAPQDLQMKVGTGAISEETVKQAQQAIEESKVDFAPVARPDLNKLQEAIVEAHMADNYEDLDLSPFTKPIMNLKANAGTFDYNLVGEMSNTVLLFLDSLEKPDKKVVQIIDLLYKTILLIIAKEMDGDGGNEGQALNAAFQEVCQKYKAKAKS